MKEITFKELLGKEDIDNMVSNNMKAISNLNLNLLDIEEEKAKIEETTKNGYFKYSIDVDKLL